MGKITNWKHSKPNGSQRGPIDSNNYDDYKFGLKRIYTTIETKSTVVADTIFGFEFTPFVKTVWI